MGVVTEADTESGQLQSLKNERVAGYMVSQGRFELPTFPLGGGCSIQLSY